MSFMHSWDAPPKPKVEKALEAAIPKKNDVDEKKPAVVADVKQPSPAKKRKGGKK